MIRIAMPTPRGKDVSVGLSVVVPVFNEEEVITETHRRLMAACLAHGPATFEIVYVDDGSSDGTWDFLSEIARQDERVVAVKLSRNFGHQLALTAGLEVCRGERILMIDADLQDPPELLSEMMAVMDAGADVVYGQRIERKGETAFKLFTARVFYGLLNRLTDVRIPQEVGDFRLISRDVLQALRAMPEQHRFVRGMVSWLGYRQVALPYVRQERFAGSTKYPLKKMLRLAVDAITGFSVVPLRASLWLAGMSLVFAIAVAFYALWSWLQDDVVRGWASLTIVMTLFASAQLLCLGILGEYIGRMFMEQKARPLAIISEIATRSVDRE